MAFKDGKGSENESECWLRSKQTNRLSGAFCMSKFTANPRTAQLKLDLVENKEVVVSFDGDDVSGNGGLLLVAQAEKLTGLLAGAANRLDDHRTESLVKHSMFERVAQRVYQIVAGFAACNDSNFLRNDPALKTAVGRAPLTGEPLGSQSSHCRLENERNYKELYRLSKWLVEYYIHCHRKAPKEIVLDFDGSAVETFGTQLQAFYRGGPYQKYMYFPLFVFDQNGWLLVAALRPGDEGEVRLTLPVLKKLVKLLRKHWPRTRIKVRADGAFTSPELYQWLDDNNVQYALGMKHNNSLLAKSKQFRQQAESKFKRKFQEPQFIGKRGKKQKLEKMKELRSIKNRKERTEKNTESWLRRSRVFGDFLYQANTWDRERRIIARCDFSDEGLDVRYIVTNITGYLAHQVYEGFYCQRALAEYGIKNLKETRCDRLSCSQFKANMFRLLLHAFAYVLIHQVRAKLSVERMSVEQFRRHYIHIAAQIKETGATAHFRVSRVYERSRSFRLAAKRLGAKSALAA
jgi:hypothetical protein